ncbi:hypothetical protein B5807_11204 [Epicoccum nigrum]|uniref:Uncharacterized protein n=1 Tax=Epicoccum nigrum TaxID=105696 RepID=A0A1Y2LK78_EPING|nr:hypothetical protein B5807_11204 [Epicoccum nigrum]
MRSSNNLDVDTRHHHLCYAALSATTHPPHPLPTPGTPLDGHGNTRSSQDIQFLSTILPRARVVDQYFPQNPCIHNCSIAEARYKGQDEEAARPQRPELPCELIGA